MSESEESVPRLTDAHTMRALAHPVRLALLDALRREGELTATRAGELLGESPGNMSWHLKTLAKYGYVEETGTGKGRSRPWRQVPRRFAFNSSEGDAAAQAAGEALETALSERSGQALDRWRRTRHSFDPEWIDAAFTTYSTAWVSPEELQEISAEIQAIISRFSDREAAEARGPGRRAVQLTSYGHPMV